MRILCGVIEEIVFLGKMMIRSMLSILSGYIFFYMAVLILWLVFGYGPDQDFRSSDFLIISFCFEALFAVGCGYMAAFIADRLELLHAAILSALFVISGIAYLILRLNHYPIWVPLSTIFINAPCIILGGYIRKKQVRSHNK